MKENELKALVMLAETLGGAGVVVLIEAGDECHSILDEREDLVILSINKHYAESLESIVMMNGDASVIGRSWIFPVDMVYLQEPCSEELLSERIGTWLPRIINNGIFVFLHYEEEGFEFVKAIVDKKMKNFEQIAIAGNLVAYRIVDDATRVSWSMIQDSYNRHEVIN